MKKSYKKVLHLTHTDIRSDSRILKEMTVLNKNRYDVLGIGAELYEGSKSGNFENIKIISIKLACRSLKIIPKVARHILVFIEMAFSCFPHCLKFAPKIIHCHDTIALAIGIPLKFVCGSKLVYDAHELESNRNALPKLLGIFVYLFEKISWVFVDGFITVSPSIKKWYEINFGNKKSIVAYNSPEIKNFKKIKPAYLHKKFKIPSSRKIFLYNGIIGPGRGIKSLMQVFKNKKIKSHIVFLGYGEWAPYVQKADNENSKIHFHQAVPHSQVVAVSKTADFGLCLIENVSLSDFFCLPNKLFEYAFAGLPVLASKFPDIEYVVKKHQLGSVCQGEPGHILRAVKKLEKKRRVNKFRNLKELSWCNQGKKILELYKKIDN